MDNPVSVAPTSSTLNILLAEDNPVNQKVALRVLKHLGYQADVVNNGREAVEAIAIKSYDLILMDIQMPEMNGLEATEYIRDQEKISQLPPIAIVAITANASHDDQLDLLQIKFEQPLDSIHSCTKQQLNYNVIHNDDDDCDIVQLEF